MKFQEKLIIFSSCIWIWNINKVKEAYQTANILSRQHSKHLEKSSKKNIWKNNRYFLDLALIRREWCLKDIKVCQGRSLHDVKLCKMRVIVLIGLLVWETTSLPQHSQKNLESKKTTRLLNLQFRLLNLISK